MSSEPYTSRWPTTLRAIRQCGALTTELVSALENTSLSHVTTLVDTFEHVRRQTGT